MPLKSALFAAVLLSTSVALADDNVADQELGARIGVDLNLAGLDAGGFYVAGTWLYRLTDILWFDGRAGFAIGGSDTLCRFPSTGSSSCDSAVTNGFGVDVLAGVRWWVPSSDKIQPFIAGGLGLRIDNFSGDSLTSFGIPFWVGGGVRTRVSNNIAIGGEMDTSFGPIHHGKSVGWDGFWGLKFLVGIDVALR